MKGFCILVTDFCFSNIVTLKISYINVKRGGSVLLDRFAAKLSYNRLVDVMLLPSIYEGHAPHKFESYYKPHQVFVHDVSNWVAFRYKT